MKKIVYLLLLIVMSFGLVACGGGDEPPVIEKYTITFKQTGYDDVIRKVEEGKTLATSEIPVIQGSGRTGYTIAWDVTDFSTITDDAIVNAVETPNVYNITINNAGGTGDANKQVTFDAQYTITEPTRAGYDFVKWVIVGQGETEFAASGTYTIAESITIKAIWAEQTNRLILKGITKLDITSYAMLGQVQTIDGGVAIDMKANVLFTAPVPTRSGEYFACWVDADGKYVELPNYITEDMEVTALFETIQSGKNIVVFIEDGYLPVIKHVTTGTALTDIPAVQTEEAGYSITWNADLSNVTENMIVKTVKTEKVYKIFYRCANSKIAHLVEEFDLKYDEGLGCYYQEVKYLDSFELVDEIIDNNFNLVGWEDIEGNEFAGADRYTLTEDIHIFEDTEEKSEDDMTNDENQWSPFN